MAKIKRRGATWHLRMRVPQRYRVVDGRTEIHRSLRTDSEREALIRVPAAEAAVLAELDAKLAIDAGKQSGDAYDAAVALAAVRGFTYRPVNEIAAGTYKDILDRLDAMGTSTNVIEARAVLGGIEAPTLLLSELAPEIEQLARYDNQYKNDAQLQVWRNTRKRAVANLRRAIGADISVFEIDRSVALKHRSWWQKKIASENLVAETARKEFSTIAGMLARYFDSLQMDVIPEPYKTVTIRDARSHKRNRKLEIPVDWIREKWLAVGAFDGLNSEARDILLISIETGCRQNEIHDLPASAIVLNTPIPHLELSFEAGEQRREVKNGASIRKMPLVGIALAAAKRHPDGFPRYRNTRNYSAMINKYLRANDLAPSEKHTAGGTRHLWESRLKVLKLPSDDRGELMGHSVAAARDREEYGDEMSLERKLYLINRLAFAVPEHLA